LIDIRASLTACLCCFFECLCYIVCVLRRINTVSQIILETVADRKRASCDHLRGYSLSSHGVLRIRRRNARLRCQSHDISDLLTDIEMSAFTDNRGVVGALDQYVALWRKSCVFFWVRTHPLFEMNCLLPRLHPT